MLKRGGEQISIKYEKGVVSRRFDHGGNDGLPVETETKGNAMSIFNTMCPPFL